MTYLLVGFVIYCAQTLFDILSLIQKCQNEYSFGAGIFGFLSCCSDCAGIIMLVFGSIWRFSEGADVCSGKYLI
jgi:hypothetical protein